MRERRERRKRDLMGPRLERRIKCVRRNESDWLAARKEIIFLSPVSELVSQLFVKYTSDVYGFTRSQDDAIWMYSEIFCEPFINEC